MKQKKLKATRRWRFGMSMRFLRFLESSQGLLPILINQRHLMTAGVLTKWLSGLSDSHQHWIITVPNCLECQDCIPNFVSPGTGLCRCTSFEKIKATMPDHLVTKALGYRGNDPGYELFWPGERDCKVFKQIIRGLSWEKIKL